MVLQDSAVHYSCLPVNEGGDHYFIKQINSVTLNTSILNLTSSVEEDEDDCNFSSFRAIFVHTVDICALNQFL